MKSLKMLLMIVCAVIAIIATTFSYAGADMDRSYTIDLKDVDSVTAIEALFKGSDKSLIVENGSYGRMLTLHLKDVDFDTALRIITRACGLVYKINDGAYVISPKPTPIPTADFTPIDMNTRPRTTPIETRKPILDKFQLTHTGPANILNQLGTNNSTQHSSGNSYRSNNNQPNNPY